MIELWIKKVKFSDQTELVLGSGSIVVIVGPNNSGKSEAIRNLSKSLARPVEGPVVVDVEYHQAGDRMAFERWLSENAVETEQPPGPTIVERVGAKQPKSQLLFEWEQGPPFYGVAQIMTLTAMAEARLSLVKPVESYATRTEHPSNAIQYLYADPQAERRLANAITEAFGTGVVVDRTGGSRIYLLFGDPPQAEATLPPTADYLAEIEALKQVDEQGDGVKSFTGLELAVGTGIYPLVFVDEPEAFLHPPQARLLGRRLAASAGEGSQVFLATHSADLLQGLIEEKPDAVNVVRITRSGDVNPTAVLSSGELKVLWEEPLLRYSNVLDGLFHDRVVVCEADGDCRFYGAVADHLAPEPGKRKQEILFTYSGGKSRLHSIVRALRAVAVPTSVIADIDLLRVPADVQRLVEALGGDWSTYEGYVNSVKEAVDRLPSETLVENLTRDFESVFADREPKSIALPEDVRKARSKLKVVDGWTRLKSAGIAGMPPGQPSADLQHLLQLMRDVNLHVVPVGELEGFNRTIGNKGPQWVAEALEAGTHRSQVPQDFMRQVLSVSD